MKYNKLIIFGILILLIIIITIQNTETVRTHILFFTITMPRAVLLLLMTLIGFVMGVFSVFHYMGKRNRGEMKDGD